MIHKEQYPDNLIIAMFEELKEYSKSGLENALSTLTEREEEVLLYRFRDGLNLMEVGKIYNITRERIRQIEAKALRKLRHPTRRDVILTAPMVEYKELQRQYAELQGKYNTLTEAFATLNNTQAQQVPEEAKRILNGNKPLEEMDLSVRSYNILKRAGVNTAADIAKLTLDDLQKIRNMGRKSVEEILKILHECGYKLEGE